MAFALWWGTAWLGVKDIYFPPTPAGGAFGFSIARPAGLFAVLRPHRAPLCSLAKQLRRPGRFQRRGPGILFRRGRHFAQRGFPLRRFRLEPELPRAPCPDHRPFSRPPAGGRAFHGSRALGAFLAPHPPAGGPALSIPAVVCLPALQFMPPGADLRAFAAAAAAVLAARHRAVAAPGPGGRPLAGALFTAGKKGLHLREPETDLFQPGPLRQAGRPRDRV